jgi:hypothetical protein
VKVRVIDTNVLLVANGSHEGVSAKCIRACIDLLNEIKGQGLLILDDRRRILTEYMNSVGKQRNRGVGDVFAKWVAQNLHNRQFVEEVALTEGPSFHFAEFPVPPQQEKFDPADRKFVATANAHPDKPLVAQATDCKWIDFWRDFAAAGISVEFLCGEDICNFYRQKFPEAGNPKLP